MTAKDHSQEPVAEIPSWKEIEPGRFQPRRIRGSCVGRELGWTFTVPPGSGDQEHESEHDAER